MTRKLDTFAKLFQAMTSKTYVDKTSRQLTKVTVDHHAGSKNEQMNYENSPRQI